MKITFISSVLMILSLNLSGQDLEKKIYRAVRTIEHPVINGVLDDNCWSAGIWSGDFVQHDPLEGALPKQKTEFKILYDDSNIYVAIKAFDTAPDSIVDIMTRRDNSTGDFVSIVFDSYNDLRTGFGFKISSSGTKSDMMLIDNGVREDNTWDPVWYGKTSRNSEGWVAEMRIPLTQLRFNADGEKRWGLLVERMVFRNRELSHWQPIPKNTPGYVHLIGILEGIDDLKPRRQFDITPFTVAQYNSYKREEGNPFMSGRDYIGKIGIDAKVALSNNFVLDLTVLPDFGQVEADPSEVNLTAFESYFSEKRPFFVEGRSIFNLKIGYGEGDLGNDNLFYSRRIGRSPHLKIWPQSGEYINAPSQTRILGAAKVTGKTTNGLSIGIMNALTAPEKAEIRLGDEVRYEYVEPLTNYFAGRIKKEYNRGRTSFGGLVTNAARDLKSAGIESIHKSATTGGVDFQHYWKNMTWLVNGSASFSYVTGSPEAIAYTQLSSAHYFQRPDANYLMYNPTITSLSGFTVKTEAGKVGGRLNYKWLSYWKSPGYETNDLGYMRSGDEFLQLVWIGYRLGKPVGIIRDIRLNSNSYATWDCGLNLTGLGTNVSIYTLFKNLWYVSGLVDHNGHLVKNTVLRGGPAVRTPPTTGLSLNIGTNSGRRLAVSSSTSYRYGKYNYSEYFSISGTVRYRPFNVFSFSFSPGYEHSDHQMQYISSPLYQTQSRYILATISQRILSMSMRVSFNITPELSFEYWAQPFLASNGFRDYKYITNPLAKKYADRFHVYSSDQLSYQEASGRYFVDEDTDGNPDYSFWKPDFNTNAFLSNMVVRWEFLPGSVLYLVWSQNRDYFSQLGEVDFNRNLSALFSENKPYNSLMVKFSYRFGLR
jgi:hypothetical protein